MFKRSTAGTALAGGALVIALSAGCGTSSAPTECAEVVQLPGTVSLYEVDFFQAEIVRLEGVNITSFVRNQNAQEMGPPPMLDGGPILLAPGSYLLIGTVDGGGVCETEFALQ